ncbi:hypothetical protein KI387_002541, partial [Taxus chinensis]
EKHQRQPQQRNFSGPLTARGTTDINASYESFKPSEDRSIGPFVQQKGRFKVTSADVDPEV